MKDKLTFKIVDASGEETEYEIILAFKWNVTEKNYLVYTDNTKDDLGRLRILAAIYYPNDDTRLDPIETEEEWNEIDKRLKEMQ